MKVTKSLNHEDEEKTKLNKLKVSKKNHLWVQGEDKLQIYDYPLKIT